MLVTQFDKFVNRSTQEILGSEIERENLEPMLSTDIRNGGGVTGVKGNAEIYYRTGNVNLTPADLGALDTDNVYNGLDETSEGYALDARQGKVLNESISGKLDKANVYNGLDETSEGYALDARQGKVLADKLDATQSDIAIIIEGNQTTHTGGVAVGEYVIVRNSTISGITDGLYTAAQAIPANTAIDSTYLAAMDGGGLNELNSKITLEVLYDTHDSFADSTGTNVSINDNYTYIYKENGLIHFKGYITLSANVSAWGALFKMKSNIRARTGLYFNISSGSHTRVMYVNSNGDVSASITSIEAGGYLIDIVYPANA